MRRTCSPRQTWWWWAILLRAGILNWKRSSTARFRIARCRRFWKKCFCPGTHSIVVSGTHGKTTTTAMLAWIFHTAGKQPNFLVGGVAENFGKSYGLGGGEEFILEGDEYETAFWDRGPKFFHYHPDDLIVTSLEYDHADIYPDFETYQLAFRRLVNLVPRRGRVVIWGDTDGFGAGVAAGGGESILSGGDVRIFARGTIGWRASLAIDGETMRFRVTHHGEAIWRVRAGRDRAAQRVECDGGDGGGARTRDRCRRDC